MPENLIDATEVQRLQDELAQAREENGELTDLYTTYRGLVHDGVHVADVIKHLRSEMARLQAERDRALAVVEAVKTYRQAAAAAGNPMWPWPALEIALAAFDAAQEDTA